MCLLKLKPSCKDYIWGGHRLAEEYGKEYDGEVLAETWELSCHPDGPSYIANGKYAGQTLQQYIDAEGKEMLGTNSPSITSTCSQSAEDTRRMSRSRLAKSAERMEGAILIIFLPLLEGKFRIPW